MPLLSLTVSIHVGVYSGCLVLAHWSSVCSCAGTTRLESLRFCTCMHAKSLPLFLTLCDPMDCNPPGSSVHGIIQARILEWVSTSYSRGIFPTQGSMPHLFHLLHGRQILYHCATCEAHRGSVVCLNVWESWCLVFLFQLFSWQFLPVAFPCRCKVFLWSEWG